MNKVAVDRRAHPEGATFAIWRTSDAWRIRRMDWPQPAGTQPRGSLLFLNGRGDFIEKYIEVLAHWHSRGWNVTAFDWRGQGGSAWSIVAGHVDSFDLLVKDGGAFIDKWLIKNPGPHVAVAHSMGGHLLLRILAEKNPKFSAIALVAPMLAINSGPLPRWLARPAAALLTRIGARETRAWKHDPKSRLARQPLLTSCKERFSDEIWWKEKQRGFDIGPPTWGWLRAAYASMAKVKPRLLRKIDKPVLLVGTEIDRLVDPREIKRAAGLLPNSQLVMFRDSAHEILREVDAIRLFALQQIDDFLEWHARK